MTTKTLPENLMVEIDVAVTFTAKGTAKIRVPINASEEEIERALEDYPFDELEDVDFPDDLYDYSEVWKPEIKNLQIMGMIGDAFMALEKEHNIAPVANMCCNSDSLAQADELYERNTDYIGCVYIHSQNVEDIIEDGQCAVGFGARKDDEAAHIAIGNLLLEALTEAGLAVAWDGTADQKLIVKE